MCACFACGYYLAGVKPNRRSIRLPGYNYASAGWYFVTICCKDRMHLFGEIVGAYGIRPQIGNDKSPQEPQVILSQLGEIVRDEWLKTAEMRPEVELGEFVVMPNHFHAIIGLFDNAMLPMETGLQNLCDTPMQTGVCDTPLRSPAKTIGAIIRGFKSAVTGHARRKGLAVDIWQRNYYEHIIRNEESYRKIAGYIRNNLANWQEDEYFR